MKTYNPVHRDVIIKVLDKLPKVGDYGEVLDQVTLDLTTLSDGIKYLDGIKDDNHVICVCVATSASYPGYTMKYFTDIASAKNYLSDHKSLSIDAQLPIYRYN